jgi:hypothetical protein
MVDHLKEPPFLASPADLRHNRSSRRGAIAAGERGSCILEEGAEVQRGEVDDGDAIAGSRAAMAGRGAGAMLRGDDERRVDDRLRIRVRVRVRVRVWSSHGCA